MYILNYLVVAVFLAKNRFGPSFDREKYPAYRQRSTMTIDHPVKDTITLY
jgi:hypothetical protein